MPSLIVGAQSGGVPLVSGMVYSGYGLPKQGVRLYNDVVSSGPVYAAWSGGVTIGSGGALTSGGMNDGIPIPPNVTYHMPMPPGGPASVYLTITAANSGLCRVWWNPTP